MPATFPQFVTVAIIRPFLDPPDVKCLREVLKVKHLVVFLLGIVTGGLELWERHQCMDGLFRKRLWGGTFGEVYKRPSCLVQHMSLDKKRGMYLSSIRLRPVRDQSLSRIKRNIELMVEAPAPIGDGGGPNWGAKHIKAVMNIGVPFLGIPKAIAGLFSTEAKDIASAMRDRDRRFTDGSARRTKASNLKHMENASN
ncbi:unnamed protein product [Lactuca saligna]|uniref:Uncharacterized protein n=1 Tax=Lactuca saligna TaxID=75948 RepID=A0AA35Z302_LACSI|nr:unnamed protein product [Lactuca saligna]